MVLNLFKYENKLEVGVDEAGLGCLFGRVYAACVILPHQFNDDIYKEIKDSKKLSEKKREYLYDYIISNAIDYGIGFVDEKEIDRINILQANYKAMHNALDKLSTQVDIILVDGDKFKPYIDFKDEFVDHECIIKGDNKYLSIACASILAKVSRDRYIKNLIKKEPILKNYYLDNNKGYGTKQHINKIKELGITNYHRKSFGICKLY